MSAKITFRVAGVTNAPGYWTRTDPHRAKAWTVAVYQSGHFVRLSRVRYAHKEQAVDEMHRLTNALKGPARQYKLSTRMPKKEEG